MGVLCLPTLCLGTPPQRIVSLDLCTDWMLARHAERGSVIALSPMQKRFPVSWVDVNWPIHDGSLETIIALKPDLVITGQYNVLQLRSRLKTLGVRVEIMPLPTTLAAVTEYEKRLLSLIGLPTERASQAPTAQAKQKPPKRLLLLGPNGYGTGRGTLENDLLSHAGWDNYLNDEGYIALDLERLATDPPDAVLWAAPASQAQANRFAEHPILRRAIPQERWLTTDYWRWQCPGPWTWELIDQMRVDRISQWPR